MRRMLLCACVLHLLALPAMAYGQGLPGFGALSSGSDSSLFESTVRLGELNLKGGFLVHNRGLGVGHAFDAKENPVFNLESVEHEYNHNGFFLGFSQLVSVGNRFDVEFEGSYIFHEQHKAFSRYRSNLSPQASVRRWKSESTPSTWYVDAAILWSYSPWLRNIGWSFVNGFRYDHYHRKFKNPGQLTGFGGLPQISGPTDTLDIRAHTFIPYAGMQKQSVYSHGSFKIGSFVGIVFGNLHHEEIWGGGSRVDSARATYTATRSWWFEALIEWHHKISSDVSGGLYVQMGGFHALGDGSIRSTLTGVSQSDDFGFAFLKLNYFAGAEFSLKFASLL